MEDCLREFGVTSFKIYMMLRGALGRAIVMDQVAEEAPMETADVDFDNGHLYDVFRTASTLPARLRINVHSEDADIVASEIERVRELGWDGLAAWHAARPGHAEAIAIQTVGYLSQQFDVPAYFPHIGSRHGIEALTELREKWQLRLSRRDVSAIRRADDRVEGRQPGKDHATSAYRSGRRARLGRDR